MRVRILVYLFVIILVSILVSIGVHSFGISYEYMKNNTLELYPGQTYMFELVVQNKDEADIRVKVTLDSSIATLEGGPELDVPGNTYDRNVFFKINVPEDAQIGDMFNINYLVAPVGEEEGQVPLIVNYDRNFKVTVVPKPEGVWVEEGQEGTEEEEPAPEEKEKSLITGDVLRPLGKIPVWASLPVVILLIGVLVVIIWRKSNQISGGILGVKDKKTFAPAPKEQETKSIRAPLEKPEEHDSEIKKHEPVKQEEIVKSVKPKESLVSIKDKLEESKPMPGFKVPEVRIQEPEVTPEHIEVEQGIKPILEPGEDTEIVEEEHVEQVPIHIEPETPIEEPEPEPEPEAPAEPEPVEETPEPIEEQVEHYEEGNEQFGPDPLFYLNDGRKLRDVEDLYHVLKNMSQQTFDYHVNPYKNDFASWIGDALGDSELASKLSMVKSRQDMFSTIEDILGRTIW